MIYLVRHGQTIWNIEGKRQGSLDSPLTLEGIDQAKQVATTLCKSIKNIHSFKFFSSPLPRCKQFTSLICEHLSYPFGLVNFSENIAECNFGEWEGLSEAEAKQSYPNVYKKRQTEKWKHIISGGESYENFYNRVKDFLLQVETQNCVVVAHEGTSKMVRGIIEQKSYDEILKSKHKQPDVYKIIGGDVELLSLE